MCRPLISSTLLFAALLLPPWRAAAEPAVGPSGASPAAARGPGEGAGLRPSGVTLETLFALQSRPSAGSAELIGGALRLDTTTDERPRGWYLRLDALVPLPVHAAKGDPNFHVEAGLTYRPRLRSGPLGVGVTLSAGPALGWVREHAGWNCDRQPCVRLVENRLTAGAAADAAVDLHVHFVTLSLQTRWRTAIGSQGTYHTWSIGPHVGARW
jgi:hypothetical protein